MTKQDVVDFIANGFSLGNLPDSFQRLNEIANDPHSDIEDVVEVVRHDPELAANLLRLANSSFYNQGDPVSTIEEAAQKLGLRVVVESSLALGIIKAIAIDPTYFDLHAFWRRSLSIAYLTEVVLQFMPSYLRTRTDANTLFTAGLLHDLGLLVLIQGFPDTMMGIVDHALNEDIPLQDAEQAILGFTHQDVGRVLFKKWSLPEQFLAVAGYHHKPMELTKRVYVVLVDAIHISDFICSNRAIAHARTTFKPILYEDVWKRSGIGLEQMPDLCELADRAATSADLLLLHS